MSDLIQVNCDENYSINNNIVLYSPTIVVKMQIKKTLQYLMRTKKKDPMEIQNSRKLSFQKLYQHQYAYPTDQHKDLMFCQTIYGRNCYVVGLTPNSQQSSTFINSALSNMRPNHVILGNFNNSAIKTIFPFSQSTKITSQLTFKYQTKHHPEDLFCKSILTPLIYEQVTYNPDWYVIENKHALLIADHTNSRIITNDYLTAINLIAQKSYTKMTFGIPSDLIVFEDIMLRYEVQQLREAFTNILGRINKYNNNQDRFKYMPGFILDEIKREGELENLLYEKQLTYMTALLNNACSVSERAMIFISKKFAEQIAENVHKINIPPKSIYRNFLDNPDSQSSKHLSEIVSNQNRDKKIDQLLQKLVILCITKNNDLQIQLVLQKKNIFQQTIFKQLFQNIPIQQIISRYRAIKKPYINKILNIQFQRLEFIRTEYQPHQKLLLTLPEQILTLQQRNIDFPPHFQGDNARIRAESQQVQRRISKQMAEIVEKQKFQDDKELYSSHMKGTVSKQSIIFITKLIGQAKIRLGIKDKQFKNIVNKNTQGKFPTYHYEAFRHIFKQQLSDQIIQKNQSSRKIMRQINKKLSQNKNKIEGNFIELDDPDDLQKHIGDKMQAKDVPRINIQFDENGNMNMRNQNPNQDVSQMIKDMGKDPFFAEIKQSIEKEIQKQGINNKNKETSQDNAEERISKRQKL